MRNADSFKRKIYSYAPVMLLLAIFSVPALQAAESFAGPHLYVSLPLFDYPWVKNNAYRTPSMQQSMGVASSFYESMHWGIGTLFYSEEKSMLSSALEKIAIVAVDFGTLWFPGSAGWQHEEWHRAVLSHRDIGSYNTYYDFNLFASTITVNKVRDSDLERLKMERPADMVRLSSAGSEAQYELVTVLEKNSFFRNTNTWNNGIIFLSYFITSQYMFSTTTRMSDEETDARNRDEGADIQVRDVIGPDFTAWTHDLFHPDEPYSARGVHPSGTGIDRYVKFSDLNSEEQKFLKKQVSLSLLNFMDPMMLGFDYFTFNGLSNGKPLYWMASIRHELTSFGYTMALQAFFRFSTVRLFGRFDCYVNHEKYLPGIDISLIDYPLEDFSGIPGSLSLRFAGWLQPREQMFFADKYNPGGLVAIRYTYTCSHVLDPYIEIEQKSAGWVPGNVSLERATSLRLGISYLLN